jgi:4-carboxymuconolactone decarboxylase
MARDLVRDPALYGWSWPIFGIAAAASTFAAAPLRRHLSDRRLWLAGHLAMAAGVVMPLVVGGLAGIIASALLVGGTFMVVTMVGMQEARRVAGADARRLMAAMTSAFAAGQIAGPLAVSALASAGAGYDAALVVSGVLLVGQRAGARSRNRGEGIMIDRMPPLASEAMNPAQQAAAAALIAGPRKGVFGPFIPLLRSPELMDRLQRVGEYLRFGSVIPAKLNELAMLVTARHVTNQFEWAVHHPLAIKAGVAAATVEAIGRGERPQAMPEDEALLHDFCRELLATYRVSDSLYARAVVAWGEQGVIDLIGCVGYFLAICLVMNAAGTPAPASAVPPLAALTRP